MRLDTARRMVKTDAVAPHWVAGIGVLNSERTSAHLKRFFCACRSMAGAIWGSSERGFSEPYANPLASATLLFGVNGGGSLHPRIPS